MVVKLLQFEIILKGSPGKRGGGKNGRKRSFIDTFMFRDKI